MLSPEAEYLYRRMLSTPNTVYPYSTLEYYLTVEFESRLLTVPEIKSAVNELVDIQVVVHIMDAYHYRVLEAPEIIYGYAKY